MKMSKNTLNILHLIFWNEDRHENKIQIHKIKENKTHKIKWYVTRF